MKIVKLDQRSDEWLEWRSRGLGGSDAAVIMERSPWNTREKLLAEKRDGGSLKLDSSSMARGRRLEPVARGMYQDLMGITVIDVCGEHEEYPWLRASCDGYNAAASIVVEIKAPNRDDHFLALYDRQVPSKYVDQVNHLLLVTGARTAHYVSYSPQQPYSHQRFAVVEVLRDEQALKTLLNAEFAFWLEVTGEMPMNLRHSA